MIELIFWTVVCITAYCIIDRVCIAIENMYLDEPEDEYVVTHKGEEVV